MRRESTRDAILACVRERYAAEGVAPSVREIMDAVGLATTSAVVYHLRALVDAGLLVNRGRRGYVPA